MGSWEGIRVAREQWHPAWHSSHKGVASTLSVADLWDHHTNTWKEQALSVLFDVKRVNVIKDL
jgi:hypothetical protein